LQSAASALLAPLLRYVTDELAASWRRRLTAAHRRYLSGSTFYAASQLTGMQASVHCHAAAAVWAA
jgi:ABC transporter transmembrane region 2